MQIIKRFIDDNERLELLSEAKNVDHADIFYDVVAGHAQEFLSVIGDSDDTEPSACVLASKSTLGQLTPEEVEALRFVYSTMYSNVSWSDYDILTTFKKFSHVTWYGKQITSMYPMCMLITAVMQDTWIYVLPRYSISCNIV